MYAIAVAFVCIVGGVYSLFMLRDSYKYWTEHRGGGKRVAPTHRPRRAGQTSSYDWWCQAIIGVLFLAVAAPMLASSWQDIEQFADNLGPPEAFSRAVEVPGMLPVPNFSVLRDINRPGRPIWCVNLSNLPATDSDVRALTNEGTEIEALILNRTDVTDESLTQIRPLTRLNSLSLATTLITDSGCKAIAQIASLNELDISDTAITDEGLACLPQLPHLTHLNLDATRITDAGCKHLAQIATLERLSLGNTEISDAGIKYLSGLPNLRQLKLTGTRITDSSAKLLQQLCRLEHLSISGTNLTRQGLQHLENALPNLDFLRTD